MARSFLYTNTLSWEEVFSGPYTTVSSADAYFIVSKMIDGVECSITYVGSALLGDSPVINEVLVTSRGADLARIVRYWDGDNDYDITRSVQALQSGGLDSFAHLMASEDWSVQIGSEQADIMKVLISEYDYLSGRSGNDTLIGGATEDTFDGGEDFDYASYETAGGGVFVSIDGYTLDNTGEAYGDQFISTEGLIGSAYDDHLIGGNRANHLLGENGNDTLSGNNYPVIDPWDSGVDTLDGGSGIDTAQFLFNMDDYDIVNAGGGYWSVSNRTFRRDAAVVTDIEFLQFADQRIAAPTGLGPIYGTSGSDDLTDQATSGADTIYGYGQDSTTDLGDTLDGAGGNDTIHGGDGGDTIYGGGDSDHLYGDQGNDRLYGGDANGLDTSADTLSGGAGSDIYYVDGSDTVFESGADNGQDQVHTSGSFTLGAGQAVELLQAKTGAGDIDLTGNELPQDLIGNAGDNRLDGRNGGDTLQGLGGNDTYVLGEGDTVDETNSDGSDTGGVDTVETSLDNYILGANLENLILLPGAIRGTGNALANTITGNAAANIINGGAGADTMEGRGGNDTYRIDDPNDVINEASSGDIDTLISSVSYTLAGAAHVEILRTDGTAAIDLTGNDFANTFHGNSANNRFDGRGGQDTVVLTGRRADYEITLNGGILTIKDKRADGDGTDTVTGAEIFQFSDRNISFDSIINAPPSGAKLVGDVIEENSKAGAPIGRLSVIDDANDSHLFALVDNAGGRFSLDADGTLRVANGVLLDYEQAQKHTIEVTVTDLLGEKLTQRIDVTVGDSQAERAIGSAFADVIKGGYGNDVLSGVGGNDLLSSGIGNDRLIGGLGKDTLTGGSGRDVFVFDDRDTGSSKSRADYISDFSGRRGDKIDLKAVDANTKKRGDQKFSFIGDDKSFSKAGEVRFEKTKSATYVYLNTDNDRAAEAVIKLKGSIELSKSWFML